MKKLAIVVPCYNEEKRLKLDEFEDFISKHSDTKIYFVNDGSSDNTAGLIKNFISQKKLSESFELVDIKNNKGKQEAVRQGVGYAYNSEYKFDFFAFLDADLATLPQELYSMFEYIQQNNKLKSVIGSRVRLMGYNIKRKVSRHYLGRVFVTVVNTVFPFVVYDTQCGAKIFSRDVIEPLFLRSKFISKWIFDVEVLLRLKLYLDENFENFEFDEFDEFVHEYPLRHWEDVEGSSVKPRHFALAFFDIIKLKFFYCKKKVIKMKMFFIVAFTAVWLCSCQNSAQSSDGFVNVSSSEAAELIEKYQEDESFVILDIRTPVEYDQIRIKGAINIGIAETDFKEKLDALNKDKKYLLYCRSGNRTRAGLAVMKELGFKNVYHLNRGIITQTHILPTESGSVK